MASVKRKADRPKESPKKRYKVEGRFKFSSQTQQLQAISLNHGLLLSWSKTAGEDAFERSLEAAAQANATPAFADLHRRLLPHARSLPLVIHHRLDIFNALLEALRSADLEVLADAVLDVIPALLDTLNSQDFLEPFLAPLIHQLQVILSSSPAPKTIEKALHVLAYVFKSQGKHLAKDHAACWAMVKDALCGVPEEQPLFQQEEATEEAEHDEDSDAEAEQEADETFATAAIELDAEVADPQEAELQEAEAADSEAEEDADEATATPLTPLQLPPAPLNMQRLKTHPHLRHLLAAAFAYLVRKVPSSSIDAFASLVYKDAEASNEAIATDSCTWLLAEALQSVNGALSSKAPALLSAFGAAARTKQSRAALCAALVSTLHGTTSAQTRELVLAIVQLSAHELDLLEILLGVRKGSRVPDECRQAIWDIVAAVDLDRAGADGLLVAALMWATPAENLRHVPRLFERLYASPDLAKASQITLALHRLEWPLYDHFCPSALFTSLLESDNAAAIETLAELEAEGAWRDKLPAEKRQQLAHKLEPRLHVALSALEGDLPGATDLQTRGLLNLLSLTKGAGAEQRDSRLLALVDAILQLPLPDVRQRYQRTPFNYCTLLARLLDLLSSSTAAIHARFGAIVELGGWHPEVLAVLQQAVEQEQSAALDFEASTALLSQYILSEHAALRQAAAKILRTMAPVDAQPVLDLVLSAEAVPLSFQQARERTMVIRRFEAAAQAAVGRASEVAITYLVACLKINFKPIWKDAIAVLKSLESRHGDRIWSVVAEELARCVESAAHASAPPRPTWQTEKASMEGQAVSSDSTFQCKYLNKLRRTIGTREEFAHFRQGQLFEDYLVPLSFEEQLLGLLSEVPILAQRQSRTLVPLFLSLSKAATPLQSALSGKDRRQRICAWLGMFSRLHNPKSFFQTEQLWQTLQRLLSSGSPEVQKAALACAMTWKDARVTPYSDKLFALLQSTSFRDALLQLPLSAEGEVIQPQDRTALLDILIRLLFGILVSKANSRTGRQAAILSALRACDSNELRLLVDLMLQPLKTEGATRHHRTGFLTLLQAVLKHVGDRIFSQLPLLLSAVLDIAALDDFDKLTRRLCLKRLLDFFRSVPAFDATPQMEAVFRNIIGPRLDVLVKEANQDPAVLLDLAVEWAGRPDTFDFLTRYDERLLPILFQNTSAPSTPRRLVARTLDLLDAIFLDSETSTCRQALIACHSERLLRYIGSILDTWGCKASLADDTSRRMLTMLHKLSSGNVSSSQASSLVGLLIKTLLKPAKVVPERLKAEALRSFKQLVELIPSRQRLQHAQPFSSLFQSLRTPASRALLSTTYLSLVQDDYELESTGRLLQELNSFSVKRSAEPDFDRRRAAFAQINDRLHKSLTVRQWEPLIRNALFDLQNEDELSLRTSASLTLRRFFACIQSAETQALFASVVYPALKVGVRHRTELVRTEYLHVLSAAVEQETLSQFQELRPLLMEGDEEANFFYNICHLQQHRRLRAMKRLADAAMTLPDRLLLDFCLPVVKHYLPSTKPNAPVVTDLVQQAIEAVTEMARSLQWPHYRHLLLQHIKLANRQEDANVKIHARSLVGVLKAFHFDMLGSTVLASKISHYIQSKVLDSLFSLVEQRAEETEGRRVAVAEGIAPIIFGLPEVARKAQLTRLFMNLCHILRSKEQGVRDDTRKALCKVISMDPAALPILLQEMITSLARGPQRHVLAFTLHAILVDLSRERKLQVDPATLERICGVLKEDLFGNPAADRDSTEFRQRTHMREVKSSKSMDSFALLAACIQPNHVSVLLAPIRDILAVSETTRTGNQIDDLLSRVALAIQQNPNIDALQLLNLCASLLKQNTQFLVPKKPRKQKSDQHTVVLERQRADDHSIFERNAYRFVGLGLDLLNAALRHNRFDLKADDITSRLEGLLPSVGNALYTAHDAILLKSLKILAALVRCNLGNTEATAPLLIKQVLKIVERAGTSQSEVSQAALKSLSAMLRDAKTVSISSAQLSMLLQIVGAGLEEGGDQQVVLFNTIRAIMDRKFTAPELYDLMDHVSDMLVTSQSASVRDTCRSIYLAFVLDYPQTKGRLQARCTFLVQQLQYVYESGRLSSMEILHALLSKLSLELIQSSLVEICDTLFVGLVLVLSNDDSSKCRESAAALVQVLLGRVSKSQQQKTLGMLVRWSTQDDDSLRRTAFQVFGIALKELSVDKPHQETMAKALSRAIQAASKDDPAQDDDSQRFLLPYHALVAIGKLFAGNSDMLHQDDDAAFWTSVRALLVHPHPWVQAAAARLVSLLFAASQSAQIDALAPLHPLAFPHLTEITTLHAAQLQDGALNDVLALQLVKNFLSLAKLMHSSSQLVQEGDEQVAALPWLAAKLSKQAIQAHAARPSIYEKEKANWSLQPATILRFFAALVQWLPPEGVESLLPALLGPLLRILGDSSKADEQLTSLQALANEVQEVVQQRVGETVFVQAHNRVQQAADEVRAARKEKAALLAVSNPALAAQRKEKQSKAKSEKRKRKVQAFADAKERFNEEPRKRLRVKDVS